MSRERRRVGAYSPDSRFAPFSLILAGAEGVEEAHLGVGTKHTDLEAGVLGCSHPLAV